MNIINILFIPIFVLQKCVRNQWVCAVFCRIKNVSTFLQCKFLHFYLLARTKNKFEHNSVNFFSSGGSFFLCWKSNWILFFSIKVYILWMLQRWFYNLISFSSFSWISLSVKDWFFKSHGHVWNIFCNKCPKSKLYILDKILQKYFSVFQF